MRSKITSPPNSTTRSPKTPHRKRKTAQHANKEMELSHIVGIGASAGGLEALEDFFKAMPPKTGLAFVVVQHLSPDFKSVMDELLARHTKMKIHRIESGMTVEANSIYLIPPRRNLIVEDDKLVLQEIPSARGLNLPIDIFFMSLAEVFQERAIAIVLSGTGSDGSRGITKIKETGGLVMAQDEDTAKFDGMPRSAVATGIVDFVLPVAKIVDELLRFISHPFAKPNAEQDELRFETKLDAIMRLLKKQTNIDFSLYKAGTVTRRIQRRLSINYINDLDKYVDLLKDSETECLTLAKDLLIGVTRFFRDSSDWLELRKMIKHMMLERDDPTEEFRIWSVGCSTGEEAYSIGVVAEQCFEELGLNSNFKIFATDIDSTAIEAASRGSYQKAIAAEIEPDILKRYFREQRAGYQVQERLRQRIFFVTHNILRDPPFTKMDLIVCRNLMIYFQPEAQRRVLSIFHFALKPGGGLFLGPSETVSEAKLAFDAINEKSRLFKKKAGVRMPIARHAATDSLRARLFASTGTFRSQIENRPLQNNLVKALQKITLEFAPPGLILDSEFNIMHTFGDVSPFVSIPSGQFTSEVTKLVVPQVRMALSSTLARATNSEKPVQFKDVTIGSGKKAHRITLQATRIKENELLPPYFLVYFIPQDVSLRQNLEIELTDERNQLSKHTLALEKELEETKQNLQASIEELETSNEEIQSTNEELMAANEELQSTNEELHSVNQELYTVNAEYQRKIEELTKATEDFDNLFLSTQIGTIFLDEHLKIRKFTPAVSEIVNLRVHDIGRSIDHFTNNFGATNFVGNIRKVISSGKPVTEEIQNSSGLWYLLRMMPFYTERRRIGGVVITFVDITQMKEFEKTREQLTNLLESILESSMDGYWDWHMKKDYEYLSPGFKRMLGYEDEELPNKPESWQKIVHPDDLPGVLEVLNKHVQSKGEIPFDNQVRYFHKDGSIVWIYCRGKVIEWDDRNKAVRMVGSHVNITPLKEAEQRIREQSTERIRDVSEFAQSVSANLQNPIRNLVNYSERLAKQLGASDDTKVNTYLATLAENGKLLYEQIEDIMDFVKVAKTPLKPAVTDIKKIVQQTLIHHESLIKKVGASVKIEGLPKLKVNPPHIKELFNHLLENSLSYGGTTAPEIKISAKQFKDHYEFSVNDNGIGIDPDLQTKVFEMFERLQPRSKSSGHGIGLAICKLIVEKHGGEIWVESEPGKGCTFRFTLPIN